MSKYIHKINYYETDKMGITHHSNYIRFMEEARLGFLEEIGYPMTRLEADGIASPVVSINCDYKHPSTYGDSLEIEVSIEKYTGIKVILNYVMTDIKTGVLVAAASSTHCFVDGSGRPVSVKKTFPDFDEALKSLLS